MFARIKKLKFFLIIILGWLIFLSLISLGGVLNILSSSLASIISMIFTILLVFCIGINRGGKREKNGYLGGLISGLIIIVIFLATSMIFFKNNLNIYTFIYYTILLITSIMGSIIGINKMKKEK